MYYLAGNHPRLIQLSTRMSSAKSVSIQVLFFSVIFMGAVFLFLSMVLHAIHGSSETHTLSADNLVWVIDDDNEVLEQTPTQQTKKKKIFPPIPQNETTQILNGVRVCTYYKTILDVKRQNLEYICLKAELDKTIRKLEFPICLHNPQSDTVVSGVFARGAVWEARYLRHVVTWLDADKDAGMLDVGANIGVYGLLAAHLGHRAVAVEVFSDNVELLRASTKLGGMQPRMMIVPSAVSSKREAYYLKSYKGNIGKMEVVDLAKCQLTGFNPEHREQCDIAKPVISILLDDLIHIIPFRRGIMKLDVTGHEAEVLTGAVRLFKHVTFTHVIMEWWRYALKHETQAKENSTRNLIFFFTSRGFLPYSLHKVNIQLDPASYRDWPGDVVWKLHDQ